jgi:hypothetical protein
MPSPCRVAGLLTVVFAVTGPAWAQELAPPGSGVSVQKLVIESASSHTVKYYVKGGSAQLQALVRRVEWAENELNVVSQLQLLKLDTIGTERRIQAVRAAQLTNPYFPTEFMPSSAGNYGRDGASPLQKALAGQMAFEATPQAALQLIDYLEQVQTELDSELKALTPKERKAVETPVDDLRKRVAALPHGGGAPQQPKAAAPWRLVKGGAPAAAPSAIEVEWGGTWYAAEALQVNGNQTLIHYTGWGSNWDEWVPAGRIRPAGVAKR